MSFSDTMENAVLDHVFGGPSYVRQTPLYLALFETSGGAPTDTGGGTECTGGGYARVSFANTGATWEAAGLSLPGQKKTLSDIAFPNATGAPWNEVAWWGIFDAPTGGNLLFWGEIVAPLPTISVGDNLRAALSNLNLYLD